MSWLKIVNVFFFQWFFVRLTKCTDKVVTMYTVLSYDMMADGSIGSRGKGITETRSWYSIQGFIVPTTGWGRDFVFLTKEPKFWKVTKPKKV